MITINSTWISNCSILDWIPLREVQKEPIPFLAIPLVTKNSKIHRYRAGASFSCNNFPDIITGKQQEVRIELKFSKS